MIAACNRFGGAFISRTWQPSSVATPGDGAISFGVNMGSNIGFNVISEAYVDMIKDGVIDAGDPGLPVH